MSTYFLPVLYAPHPMRHELWTFRGKIANPDLRLFLCPLRHVSRVIGIQYSTFSPISVMNVSFDQLAYS